MSLGKQFLKTIRNLNSNLKKQIWIWNGIGFEFGFESGFESGFEYGFKSGFESEFESEF